MNPTPKLRTVLSEAVEVASSRGSKHVHTNDVLYALCITEQGPSALRVAFLNAMGRDEYPDIIKETEQVCIELMHMQGDGSEGSEFSTPEPTEQDPT